MAATITPGRTSTTSSAIRVLPHRKLRITRWRITACAAGLLAAGLLGSAPASASTLSAPASAPASATLAGVSSAPAWSLVPSRNAMIPIDALAGVSCPTARRCVAVGQAAGPAGNFRPLVKSWNSHAWSVQRPGVPGLARYSTLGAISCRAAGSCMAVGQLISQSGRELPLAERWNGRTWAIQGTPGAGFLGGVSCPSASECTAVGGTDNSGDASSDPVADRWNGRKWAAQKLPGIPGGDGDATLNAVACTSATACIAVGGNFNLGDTGTAVAMRWNGRTWAVMATPGLAPDPQGINTSLTGISCTSARACIAVGDSFTLGDTSTAVAMRWNGRTWTALDIPDPAGPAGPLIIINGISCASASMCIAVGDAATFGGQSFTFMPLTERWNGRKWAIQTSVRPGADAQLEAVSCSSALACTSVGSIGDKVPGAQVTLAERWNGVRWSFQPTPGNPAHATGALASVSCRSRSNCTAVGSGGSLALAEHWNGTRWSLLRPVVPVVSASAASSLTGISCTSITSCIAVGSYHDGSGHQFGLAEGWNGSSWAILAAPGAASSLSAISCTSATACMAVGSAAAGPVAESWNGAAWTPQEIAAGPTALAAVRCTSAAACTAVGSDGSGAAAERWDGTSWALQPVPAGGALAGLSCPTATDCVAVGAGDTIDQWNGTTWSAQTAAPAAASLSGVSCTSASACTAVGAYSSTPPFPFGAVRLVEHWNGRTWAIQRPPVPAGSTATALQGVSCTSARWCMAVGQQVNTFDSAQTMAERYS